LKIGRLKLAESTINEELEAHKGLFMCKTCGEENADRNVAFNIAYRALGYISKVGVTVNIPITLASTGRSSMTRKRLPV